MVKYSHHFSEFSIPLARTQLGTRFDDDAVPTPFAYVDLDVLGANLDEMAQLADGAGLALRPHAKTHKLAAIARYQLAAGAEGLTVATLGEAEALVAAGVRTSYLIAHPIWSSAQLKRLGSLAGTSKVIACVDSADGARRLAEAAQGSGDRLDVSIIVDTGYHRFGVTPERTLDLAREVAGFTALRLVGIRSHAGHAYGEPDPDARARIAHHEIAAMTGVADELRSAGFDAAAVSVGSTPGARALVDAPDLGAVTEMRPGNYVFYDRQQASMGVAHLDRCALTVVTTVVSRPRPDVAIVDAGKLTLSSTADPLAPGYGHVVGQPDAVVAVLSQEAATIEQAGEPLALGARVRIVPNHACEITNLAARVYFGTGGRINGAWMPEAARRSS